MLEFKGRDHFEKTVAEHIMADMKSCHNKSVKIHLLLSGGSTPGPIYSRINQDYLQLNLVKIGLVDERYVENIDTKSNELLLRNCFTNLTNTPANIVGMVYDTADRLENLRIARLKYAPFVDRLDLVVLGMGEDGHTASIFPGDSASSLALESPESTLFTTEAPVYPQDRITCSYTLLRHATFIYLIITGKKKKDILFDKNLNLPIHTILKDRPDLKIYYLDHD